MVIRVIVLTCLISVGCQSGKIPCPHVKFAKVRHSNPGKKAFFGPPNSKVYATTKTYAEQPEGKHNVNLDKLKSSRTTGQQMLDRYGSVDGWDCPSPGAKKRYSKVAKENIRRNEKKMKEHLKREHESDSIASFPMH